MMAVSASTAIPAAPFQPLCRSANSHHPNEKLVVRKPPMSASVTQSTPTSSLTSRPSTRSMEFAATASSILKVKTQEASLAIDMETLRRRRPRRKKVRHSTLEIRSYPFCLGHNPAVRGGLPLALDYSQPCETEVMRMDDYERQRPPRKKHCDDLRLSPSDRQECLNASQIGLQELCQCMKGIKRIQHQRGWTQRTRPLEPSQEGLEVICKSVGNATWNRRRKGNERELLRAYKSKDNAPLQRQ